MTAEPEYVVMGMSLETFFGGWEGNKESARARSAAAYSASCCLVGFLIMSVVPILQSFATVLRVHACTPARKGTTSHPALDQSASCSVLSLSFLGRVCGLNVPGVFPRSSRLRPAPREVHPGDRRALRLRGPCRVPASREARPGRRCVRPCRVMQVRQPGPEHPFYHLSERRLMRSSRAPDLVTK